MIATRSAFYIATRVPRTPRSVACCTALGEVVPAPRSGSRALVPAWRTPTPQSPQKRCILNVGRYAGAAALQGNGNGGAPAPTPPVAPSPPRRAPPREEPEAEAEPQEAADPSGPSESALLAALSMKDYARGKQAGAKKPVPLAPPSKPKPASTASRTATITNEDRRAGGKDALRARYASQEEKVLAKTDLDLPTTSPEVLSCLLYTSDAADE